MEHFMTTKETIDLTIAVSDEFLSTKAEADMDKSDDKELFIKLIAESGISNVSP